MVVALVRMSVCVMAPTIETMETIYAKSKHWTFEEVRPTFILSHQSQNATQKEKVLYWNPRFGSLVTPG